MYLPDETIPFVMEVTPLVAADVSAPRFRLARWWPESWGLDRARRQIDRSCAESPFAPSERMPLLGGAGWVVLPSDPARALGALPFALRLVRAQGQGSGIAVSGSTHPWLPRLEGCSLVRLPSEAEPLEAWCQETLGQRRGWALELGFPLDRGSLAGLRWLGGQQRIVLGPATVPGVVNIELPASPDQLAQPVDAVRRGACARLGLVVPPVEPERRRGGKSVVIELPEGVSKRQVARWTSLVSDLASDHPVVVVHSSTLVPELTAAISGLGNRTSLVRVQRAEDVLRLAADARVWVARPGPAPVIASWVRCPLVLFDRSFDAAVGYGPEGEASPAFARFLPTRLPSSRDLLPVVLDLTPHGM